MKPFDKMKHSREIIEWLAKRTNPSSPWDLKKLKIPYTGILESLKRLSKEGYVQLSSTAKSLKGGKKTLYTLTFKGILAYLFWLEVSPDVEDDLQADENVLIVLERQGRLLNYALFQESRWLSQHFQCVTRIFILEAKQVMYGLFRNHYYLPLYDERERRKLEDDLLREAFGKWVLTGLAVQASTRKLKGGMKNEKLRQFAEQILAQENEKTRMIEKVAGLF